MAIKRIPYGVSDFRRFSREDYYYVDKTRFIGEIEKCPKDQFDELFGRFYIGSHPTADRNSYLILQFNFAMVNPEPEVLEQSFEEHTSACFDVFNAKYGHLLGEGYLEGYQFHERGVVPLRS